MTRYLTPGLLVRHIADVTPAPLYGPTAVEIEALCAGRRTIALWDSVGSQYAPADEENITKAQVCPTCLTAHQSTDVEDPTMGTIPLF
jgi:hypothetical protein|nr:MAG TPA: DNA polymerase II large subunit [Caudoviricetes sp.]